MNVDPQVIRSLRLERSWSQEQLAEFAGMGLRTVQRVERGGSASPRTLSALAGVFGVAPSALSVSAATDEPNDSSHSQTGLLGWLVALGLAVVLCWLVLTDGADTELPQDEVLSLTSFESIGSNPQAGEIAALLDQGLLTKLMSKLEDRYLDAPSSLRVISATQVGARKSQRGSVQLQGAVHLEGDHVSVSVHAYDASTGNLLFAETYERSVGKEVLGNSVKNVVAEVSESISYDLIETLSTEKQGRR